MKAQWRRLPEVVRWAVLMLCLLVVNAGIAALVRAMPDTPNILLGVATARGAALMGLTMILAPKWGKFFGGLLLAFQGASVALYYAAVQDGNLAMPVFYAQVSGFAASGLVFCLCWRCDKRGHPTQ